MSTLHFPNDNIDAGSVYDSKLEMTQEEINNSPASAEVILLDAPGIYSQGIYDTTTGRYGNIPTRIMSKIFRIPTCKKVKITCPPGYMISWRLFRVPTNIWTGRFTLFASATDWTTEYIYENVQNVPVYIAFNYKTVNDSDISPTDINSTNAPTLTIERGSNNTREDNHIKILMVGNSKLLHSSELLGLLLSQNGYTDVSVIVPYKGGITLADHYTNKDNSDYYERISYYTGYSASEKRETGKSLSQIIAENPDITHVVFQQQTDAAPLAESYSAIDDLAPLFYNCDRYPQLYIMATWPDLQSEFTSNDVIAAIKTYAEGTTAFINGIIPSCYAIDKLKNNSVFSFPASANKHIFFSDGKHLQTGFPRLMASLIILSTIFGLPHNQYIQSFFTSEMCTALQEQLCYQVARETTAYTLT